MHRCHVPDLRTYAAPPVGFNSHMVHHDDEGENNLSAAVPQPGLAPGTYVDISDDGTDH